MTRTTSTPPSSDPMQDPLLAAVPTIEGFKVLGKTILLDVIGSGGMGVVYRGWHLAFRIDVAVKVLKASLAEQRDYVRRFRQESQAALKISHQNVVRAYDVEELHGLHFFVMEFVDGESAWQRVGRLGRMSPPAALTVFAGAATGLAEAHAHGLVHRDVKPGNLLIARSGRVKLADLGLVHPAFDEHGPAGAGDAASARLLGTPQYLAPEQWDGAPAQPSADVWALGATLYYLTTGRHGLPRLPKDELRRLVRDEPFPTLGGVLRELPELNAIFERCVQQDPAARFADAGELSQALLALGPGDEELLREGAPEQSAAGKGLPPNEVLGRIDMRLRRGGSAPSPAPVVVTPRRRQVAQPARSGSSGLIVVVVLAVIAIVVALLYLGRGGRRGDPTAATEEHGVLDRPPPAPDADAQTAASDPPPAPLAPPAPPPSPAPEREKEKVAANVRPAAAPSPAVDASAHESSPADVSPRATLQAWLAHSGDASHVEHLRRHHDAFLLSRALAQQAVPAASAIELPQPLDACLAAFDAPMRAYPEVAPGSVPAAAVGDLLAVAGALRRQGASIEPLLPYLLLLQKNDAADPGVAFALFEAWAVEALDLGRARQAAGNLQRLLEATADPDVPSRARLPAVVFELGSLGDDGAAMLARVLRTLVAERLDGRALGPLALRTAFVPELEAAYVKAMQAGDFDRAARSLQTMRIVDPADRGSEVLLAMVLGHRDEVSFDYTMLAPEQQKAVTERAQRLGLAQLAPQLDVPDVLAAMANAATARLPFFAVGLHADAKAKQAEVDQLTGDIDKARDAERRLRNQAENETQKAANNRQKNPVVSERAAAEARRLYGEAAATNKQVQQLRGELDQAKRDLRQLEVAVRELDRQRREFHLP